MFTYGDEPLQVDIEKGERLPIPAHVPPTIQQLMLQCWDYEPLQRPSFVRILDVVKAELPTSSSDNTQNIKEEEHTHYINPVAKP